MLSDHHIRSQCYSALAARDLSAAGAGSQFVSPSLTLGKVSDGLRPLDPVLSLGVEIQEIQGLGNVAVPSEQAVTTGVWITENYAQNTQQSTPSFGTAPLTNFRHFSAQYDVSNSLVKRAHIDGGVLEWVKRDLRKTIAHTISNAVLGLYRPGDRLLEADVATKFKVSRSPVRKALQALESEVTPVATPYTGAMVRPLSTAEIDEIAEIRLTLISLALKPARGTLRPLTLTWRMTWLSESRVPKVPEKLLNLPTAFGTSSFRRLNVPFSGKCSRNWTIA